MFARRSLRIARDLVEERLARGLQSGYRFLFADGDHPSGALDGYSCYGPVDGTERRWDLFWIAVAPSRQGHGLGRALLAAPRPRSPTSAAAWSGSRRAARRSTNRRGFYERCGCHREAELRDVYAPGDAKVVYLREVPAAGGRGGR